MKDRLDNDYFDNGFENDKSLIFDDFDDFEDELAKIEEQAKRRTERLKTVRGEAYPAAQPRRPADDRNSYMRYDGGTTTVRYSGEQPEDNWDDDFIEATPVPDNGNYKQAAPAKPHLAWRITKKVSITAGVLVLVVVVLAAAVFIYFIDKIGLTFATDQDLRSQRIISDYQEEFFDILEAPAAPGEEATQELPEIILPEGISAVEVPEVINVILVGTDERTTQYTNNSRGDSITIVSINTEKRTLKLSSMRRELYVPEDMRTEHPDADILTHFYRFYREEGVMKLFEKYLGVKINYYVRVNFGAFTSIVDRMGGVDVNLTEAEANYINTQKLVLCDKVKTGAQHLDGSQALIYARIRKSSPNDSNVQRVRRQRTVLSQLANKGSKLSIADLNDILNSIIDAVQTDMPNDMILTLLTYAPDLLKTNLNSEDTYISIPQSVRTDLSGDYKTNGEYLRKFLYGKK